MVPARPPQVADPARGSGPLFRGVASRMSLALPGALARYCWSERVATLYHSEPLPRSTRPGRVTRVERGAVIAMDCAGHEAPYVPAGPVAVGDWVILDAERLTAV